MRLNIVRLFFSWLKKAVVTQNCRTFSTDPVATLHVTRKCQRGVIRWPDNTRASFTTSPLITLRFAKSSFVAVLANCLFQGQNSEPSRLPFRCFAVNFPLDREPQTPLRNDFQKPSTNKPDQQRLKGHWCFGIAMRHKNVVVWLLILSRDTGKYSIFH